MNRKPLSDPFAFHVVIGIVVEDRKARTSSRLIAALVSSREKSFRDRIASGEQGALFISNHALWRRRGRFVSTLLCNPLIDTILFLKRNAFVDPATFPTRPPILHRSIYTFRDLQDDTSPLTLRVLLMSFRDRNPSGEMGLYLSARFVLVAQTSSPHHALKRDKSSRNRIPSGELAIWLYGEGMSDSSRCFRNSCLIQIRLGPRCLAFDRPRPSLLPILRRNERSSLRSEVRRTCFSAVSLSIRWVRYVCIY